MKKKILPILSLLFTGAITAQNFQEVNYSNLSTGLNSGGSYFADVDGDNDLDLLQIGFSSPEEANLLINDGTGVFTIDVNAPFVGVGDGDAIFLDVDHDGDLDVIIAGAVGFQQLTSMYLNDGAGNYTLVANTPFYNVYNCAMDYADVDGDGDLDVLISGQGLIPPANGYVYASVLYTNDGNGVFTEVTGTPFLGASYGSVNFADIDNDNDQDVLITGYDGVEYRTSLYLNDGAGVFTYTSHPFPPLAVSDVVFADVDGDNYLDVVMSGDTNYANPQPLTRMYTNDGSGNFTLVNNTPFENTAWSSLDLADIDNDNDLDLILTGTTSLNPYNYITKLYTNDGNGVFQVENATVFPANSLGDVVFADVDNNGFPDICILGNEDMFMNNICFINASISVSGVVLTASQSGATYQWLDCNNGNSPVAGATSETFTPSANGSYSVIITENTCVDTSDCVTISSVGIENNSLDNINVYPNPSNGRFTINSTTDVNVSVYSVEGKIIIPNKWINGADKTIDLTNVEKGVYFLNVSNKNEKKTIQLLIK